jgi:hypothetical protein
VEATRNLSITRVESFRIWPPADKPLIQLGRFTFSYALEGCGKMPCTVPQ